MRAQKLLVDWRYHSTIIPSEVTWDPNDPICLAIVFHDRNGATKWTFARDLIAIALEWGKAGDGDVQVECITGIDISLTLTSDTGSITVIAESKPIAKFLDKTYSLSPRGEERIDVDSAIEKLFSW
jgi:hypothetical protein